MKKTFKKLTSFALALAMMLAVVPSLVDAANVSGASDNMTRQKVSELSDHTITFTPLTDSAGPTTVTFPADFDVSGVTGGTAAGQVVTIPGALTAATEVSFTLGNIENPGTPGNQVIAIDTGEDTGEITVPILADDQIQVNARVNQILFFDVRDTLGGANDNNTVGFGDLNAAVARFATDDEAGSDTEVASSQLEAGTNAAGGYIIDVTGETLTAMDGSGVVIGGLFTPTPTPAAGTEAFGIQVAQTQASTDTTPGSSNGVVAADYDGTYHLPDTTATDLLVTNAGPASNEIYDVNYLANISTLTPAGNYTTALTFTMTGKF